jgi:DNA-binding transcriptional ArsR family regulator
MPATLTPTTVTSTSVLERVGTALSDPTRVRVLVALRDAPAYPSELAEALGVSRQSLSNHLSCLRGCGLVVSVPEGRRSRYELVDPKLGHALTDLLGIVLAVDPEHQDHGHRMTPDGARGPGDGPGPLP